MKIAELVAKEIAAEKEKEAKEKEKLEKAALEAVKKLEKERVMEMQREKDTLLKVYSIEALEKERRRRERERVRKEKDRRERERRGEDELVLGVRMGLYAGRKLRLR